MCIRGKGIYEVEKELLLQKINSKMKYINTKITVLLLENNSNTVIFF